jgi:NAD(P)-dependent dehydrogenase (short-subunit alcohol dehydrogenase family)
MTTSSRAALVTGCSSGIGRASALALTAAGLPTYATARRVETLDELAAAGCTVLACDVTDETSMRAAVDRVVADHGALGVLVNNAGYAEYGPLEEVGLDRWRREFETNVFGLVRMTQLALPGMRAQRAGRVVNVSSMGGEMALPGGSAYHASKYAVEALSDVLRFEVAPFGVDVVVVQPGVIKTRFGDTAVGERAPAVHEGPYAGLSAVVDRRVRESYAPRTRGAGPDDVARVVVRAATTDRPRTRYKVTAQARLLPAARALLPDRAWDRLLRSQFPVAP